MVLELQLEDQVLADVVLLAGPEHPVAEEREAGQREVVLEGLEEVQAAVGEHHPQLLPPVGVLELAQQVPGRGSINGGRESTVSASTFLPAEHGLQRRVVLLAVHGGGPMPAHVDAGVGPLLARGGGGPPCHGASSSSPSHAGGLRPVQPVIGAADGLEAEELAPAGVLLLLLPAMADPVAGTCRLHRLGHVLHPPELLLPGGGGHQQGLLPVVDVEAVLGSQARVAVQHGQVADLDLGTEIVFNPNETEV